MLNVPMFKPYLQRLVLSQHFTTGLLSESRLSIWQKGDVNNGHAPQKSPVHSVDFHSVARVAFKTDQRREVERTRVVRLDLSA